MFLLKDLASVDAGVSSQSILFSERLATDFTRETLRLHVTRDVSPEHCASYKQRILYFVLTEQEVLG